MNTKSKPSITLTVPKVRFVGERSSASCSRTSQRSCSVRASLEARLFGPPFRHARVRCSVTSNRSTK